MVLPTLDLSQYTHGTAQQRQQLSSQLLDSLSRHGFVKLTRHGISRETVSKLVALNKSFFQLPAEEKQRIAYPGGSKPQRGFSCLGSENSSNLYRKGLLNAVTSQHLRDAREHFDMGSPSDPSYPNIWPSPTLLPGFQATMETTFDELQTVTAEIMSALETALALPPATFLSKMTPAGNASELRLLHYPAIPLREIQSGTVNRIWPHFDLGVITLLFQDGNCGGLEFEDRSSSRSSGGADNNNNNKRFHRVECGDPVEMVVNVSETLQRWTNGTLPAGLHRVNPPPGLHAAEVAPERFSVAYFAKADRDADVGALKEFVPEGEEAAYRSISAIDYHRQRLQSAY
ncbi:MAG: hypothetical protein LQ344_007306 [Seirophora lacunosa]|nr:MAG: hypothetical protein LQ344_007306 [Seirophora lacunosa]